VNSAIILQMSRHVNILGTLDAGTAILTPLSDRVFRKLVMLQSMLVSQLTHVAGINPRQARHARGLRSIKCGVPNRECFCDEFCETLRSYIFSQKW
jgi:hypothetical protein